MLNIWPSLIRIFKLDRFKYRHLTVGEIQLCRQVYADLIDYEHVKIMNHPFLPWQPKHVFMAPIGHIHIRNLHYTEDFSLKGLGHQAVFIHEMAHVYQHQQNINVLLRGAILQSAFFISFYRYNPYKYTLKCGKKFQQYNIEQQGDIAKDIFLGKIPNIILYDQND